MMVGLCQEVGERKLFEQKSECFLEIEGWKGGDGTAGRGVCL
jgi:hypothetical protein